MKNEELSQITNFLEISADLITGGMPTVEQLHLLKQAGVDLVINLAIENSASATPNEREILKELGIAYHNIPVVWEKPKISDLTDFFSLLENGNSKKVFVHCVLNMRVSVFVYLYYVTQKHLSPESAIHHLKKIWEPNAVWQTFIEMVLDTYRI